MISRSILFYWSKGADTRRNILVTINDLNDSGKPCFLNIIADTLKLSHVAVNKHLSILLDEKYVRQLNPSSKPVYLELTNQGRLMIKDFKKI